MNPMIRNRYFASVRIRRAVVRRLSGYCPAPLGKLQNTTITMKKILTILALAFALSSVQAQEKSSMDNQTVDGYRGIWFALGQARSGFGDKYSGGLGTYTMKHIPMAVY